jgi:hypothetical protein
MTNREALLAVVERLDNATVDRLWAEVAPLVEAKERRGISPDRSRVLDLRDDPVLLGIWDNEDDAAFDGL